MATEIDPYKVLQVDPEAEDEVIQAAYRRLAQKYHPDRQADAEATARMVAINAAWELIGEPAKRAAYDASRRTAVPPSPPRPTAAPSPRPSAASATGAGTAAQPTGGSQPRPPE